MEINGTCYLISYNPEAHEAGSDPEEIRRGPIKCTEKNVGLTESYLAKGTGLVPEIKLLIPMDLDYQGETELEYQGRRWILTRPASRGEWNGVILAIKPVDMNGRSPEATEAGG